MNKGDDNQKFESNVIRLFANKAAGNKLAETNGEIARQCYEHELKRKALIISEGLLTSLSVDFLYGRQFILALKQEKAVNNREALCCWVKSQFLENKFDDLYEAEKILRMWKR